MCALSRRTCAVEQFTCKVQTVFDDCFAALCFSLTDLSKLVYTSL